MSSTLVIGICGGSGSGKTTVTRALADRIGPDRIATISHDAYYKDVSHLSAADLTSHNFDHPDALETERLVTDLRELRAGRPAEIPIYDFNTHRRSAVTRRVEPRKVILVEGVLIFAHEHLRSLFDAKVFVDTRDDLRLIRRLRRDVIERGRTVEGVLSQYEGTVRPMHLTFVEPSKRHADVIIPEGGGNQVGLNLLFALIEQVLGR